MRRRKCGKTGSGFTLVELVVTLLLVGILAVAVVPRFASRSTFETRGFSDQVKSGLQFARKVAVASGRNVCVTAGGSSFTLKMATVRGQGATCTSDVIDPATGAAYALAWPTGVSLSSLALTFRADGSATPASVLTVSGDASYTLAIEAGTGHVH